MAKNMNIDMQVLNLEEYKQGWDMFQIKGTPTIISYKDGKEMNRILGEQSYKRFKHGLKTTNKDLYFTKNTIFQTYN
ncbi:thioredoxin [Bacillus cereus Rock3-44]|nr:thioredoxin [Bacillus cereus Rock3-44]